MKGSYYIINVLNCQPSDKIREEKVLFKLPVRN